MEWQHFYRGSIANLFFDWSGQNIVGVGWQQFRWLGSIGKTFWEGGMVKHLLGLRWKKYICVEIWQNVGGNEAEKHF